MKPIHLRNTTIEDLKVLFQFQLDEEANYMAGFTDKDPADNRAFMEKWTPLLADNVGKFKTIFREDQIVGSIGTYEIDGEAQVTYWIGKEFWGQGIATAAVTLFLEEFTRRPIFGRVAFDNVGSIRVLEKCGFVFDGTDTWFAQARGKEIEEAIYRLGVKS